MDVRGALLLLPAFGEEMNKCRRTVALAARRFAQAGLFVRLFDAYGTGDSPGEFRDATWSGWVEDYRAALADLRTALGLPVSLWAVRAGSLLATELADDVRSVLLWQPVLSGEQQLNQVLRVKVANDAFAGKGPGVTTKELRSRLEAGEKLEIAGYDLNPALVLPLAQRALGAWQEVPEHIDWLETGVENLSAPPPGSARVIDILQSKGTTVDFQHVNGEPFWMTVEIAENRALAERSLEQVMSMSV
jgi:exosortase A-associated hydrolase 2